MIFVGDDWAQDHHDVCLIDADGGGVVGERLPEGLAGVARFHELVAAVGVADPGEVVVGIETDRGLWVNALVAGGYQVYAINPASAAAYRTRYRLSGAKSDRGDAQMLADIVRTDRHLHRLVAADSDEVEGIRLMARAHQNLIWERTRTSNRLRANLVEYYPTALGAFDGKITSGDALALLRAAPTPTAGARLTKPQIRGALKRGGRQRNLDTKTLEFQTALRIEQLDVPAVTAEAFGVVTVSIVGVLEALNTEIKRLEERIAASFKTHPDAAIYLSLPGVSVITGARMMGEFGDDPERYADLKCRRNAAGTSPVTDASGKKKAVNRRNARNKRLSTASQTWAGNARLNSSGCEAFYQQRRHAGDSHHKALRALSNKLIGQLHGCLKHSTTYNEDTAWKHRQTNQQTKQAA